MIIPHPGDGDGQRCDVHPLDPRPTAFAFDHAAVNQRIEQVCGDLSAGEVAWFTGVRRTTALRGYLSGDSPSLEFVCRVCSVFGVSADWLLFGDTPPPPRQQIRLCLKQATASELLREVGRRVHTSTNTPSRDTTS